MSRKRILALALLVAIVCMLSVLALYIFRSGLVFNRATKAPARQLLQEENTESGTQGAYYFQGRFTKKLFVMNSFIMGDFVLRDDSNKVPIRVVFTKTDGNFTFGQTVGTTTTFELVKGGALLDFVEPNKLYELRIFPVQPKTPDEQKIVDMLEQLRNDRNIVKDKYGLTPSMMRNLE